MREKIHELVREFFETHTPRKLYKISCADVCYDAEEMIALIDVALDFWLTSGKREKEFSTMLADYVGKKYAIACNSGSSANLLAVAVLAKINKWYDRREIITTALAFPTTIGPIIQYGFKPVFIDVELDTLNTTAERVKNAVTNKTWAVVLSHTLGFPSEIEEIKQFCDERNIYLIEDNCDALGTEIKGKKTGSFGKMSTCSFYPSHHITTGEGGAVLTDDPECVIALRSFRDWGKDCWCDTGIDNSCGKRFDYNLQDIPYDHKYIFSRIGYNLKMTDMQAAIGLAQMKKLSSFVKARRLNYERLYTRLKDVDEFQLIAPIVDFSPFGFPIILKENSRNWFVRALQDKGIQTRMLFAGNIIRQPMLNRRIYDVKGVLENTEKLTRDAFWIGCHPRLSLEDLDFIQKTLKELCLKKQVA